MKVVRDQTLDVCDAHREFQCPGRQAVLVGRRRQAVRRVLGLDTRNRTSAPPTACSSEGLLGSPVAKFLGRLVPLVDPAHCLLANSVVVTPPIKVGGIRRSVAEAAPSAFDPWLLLFRAAGVGPVAVLVKAWKPPWRRPGPGMTASTERGRTARHHVWSARAEGEGPKNTSEQQTTVINNMSDSKLKSEHMTSNQTQKPHKQLSLKCMQCVRNSTCNANKI